MNERTCSIDGCESPLKHVGMRLCGKHYARWRTHGDATFSNEGWRNRRRKNGETCSVEDCDRTVTSRNLCERHYRSLRVHGDPLGAKWRHEPDVWRRRPDGYMAKYIDGKIRAQHRVIMEQHLGRPLHPHENVHHVNGDRADNRIENLELWSSSQPPGQRVADKILWCLEFLGQEAPDLLAPQVRANRNT